MPKQTSKAPSKSQLSSYNPATDEYLGSVTFTPGARIKTILSEMRQAQKVLVQRKLGKRKQMLKALQFEVINACDEVSLVINKNCGKSRQAGLSELFLAAQALAYWDSNDFAGQSSVQKQVRVIVCSPDYPLLLTLEALFVSIMAGCTAIIVAAPESVMVARLLERLVVATSELTPFVRVLYVDEQAHASNFSQEYLQIVATSALSSNWSFVDEMPLSNSAMIVLASADLAKTAQTAVYAASRNAGQCPTATDRIYVVASVYQQFVMLVTEAATQLTFGYSDQKKDLHDYGPLISETHADAVTTLFEEAVEKGAVIQYGGERDRLFFQPTVLSEATSEMLVVQTASHSPLIPIIRVADEKDAVEQANRFLMRSCLVWGGAAEADRLSEHLDAGEIVLNGDSAEFTISAKSFGTVLKPPATIIEQLNRPGNYRLLKTLLMAQYGATPAQRLTAIDLFRNSYKVQQLLNRVTEKTSKLIGRA